MAGQLTRKQRPSWTSLGFCSPREDFCAKCTPLPSLVRGEMVAEGRVRGVCVRLHPEAALSRLRACSTEYWKSAKLFFKITKLRRSTQYLYRLRGLRDAQRKVFSNIPSIRPL